MLIFLDLETSGLESNDKIVSIGLVCDNGEKIITKYDLVNEGKKIPSATSAVNHITNEMIKGKPKLKDSKTYKFLLENNNEETTIIAHNIKFDIEKLSSVGFKFKGNMIDTLRVTKHLIPECEAFSLQYLRYELKLYKDEKKFAQECGFKDELLAHHALSDAIFVKLLYDYLLDITTKEKMYELSFKNVLMNKLGFGKYADSYIEEVVMNDISYLHWMLSNIVDLDEDLRYSISYYLDSNNSSI